MINVAFCIPPPRMLCVLPVVCLFCRLSVCLLAISRKIYSSNLYANFTKDVSSDKDAIKFYKLSRDPAWHRSALSDSIVMRSSTN